MTQGGDAVSMAVIVEDQIETPEITSMEYVPSERGFVVSTRLPSNVFAFGPGEEPVKVSGTVNLMLAGGRRKLQGLFDAPNAPDVEEEAKYEVEFGLVGAETVGNGFSSAAVVSSFAGYASAVVYLAYSLACIW